MTRRNDSGGQEQPRQRPNLVGGATGPLIGFGIGLAAQARTSFVN